MDIEKQKIRETKDDGMQIAGFRWHEPRGAFEPSHGDVFHFTSYGDMGYGYSEGSAFSPNESGDYKPRILKLKKKISDISSIQSVSMKNNGGGHYKFSNSMFNSSDKYFAYKIEIYFKSGETFRVSENLSENDARIVVAQLNAARAEMLAIAMDAPEGYEWDEQGPPYIPPRPPLFDGVYGWKRVALCFGSGVLFSVFVALVVLVIPGHLFTSRAGEFIGTIVILIILGAPIAGIIWGSLTQKRPG